MSPPNGTETAVRKLVLALFLVGSAGMALELFFLEHTESLWQWLPLIALGAGILSGLVAAISPRRSTIRPFRMLMFAFLIIGLLGVLLHYQGNVEFALERDPSLSGLPLVWQVLRGATPALAPATLAQLGLLGFIFSWRHPALRENS
ncbi:MAG: hypothetical protein H0T21_10980 [Gemmatimonadaceae bacterium]|nr:hypothetical protein [Gemmatimonadaceae bacterium]